MNGRFPKYGVMFCEDFTDLCVWNDENVEWVEIESLYNENTIVGEELLIQNRQSFKMKSLIQKFNGIKE